LRKTLFCIAAAAFLLGCEDEAPTQSCPTLRQTYDRAFGQAVQEGAAKRFDKQERYISEAQKTYLIMRKQGCCDQANACPSLNVN
jgi:hypothetical protein